MEEEVDAGSFVDSVSLDDVTSMEPLNTCDVIVTNISHCSEPGQQISIHVTSFLVFHTNTKVTVNIGLKEVVRMVTSIPSIRCLCYKPERMRIFLCLPPTHAKSKLLRSRSPLFSLTLTFRQQLVKTHPAIWHYSKPLLLSVKSR